MRTFDTGATRDSDESKPDFEGFLSPLVIQRYGEYMAKHQTQADGSRRASDNWQKGIPKDAYIKSAWRHFVDWWLEHREQPSREGLEDALCALLFNTMGYLHETLKENSMSTLGDDLLRQAFARPTTSTSAPTHVTQTFKGQPVNSSSASQGWTVIDIIDEHRRSSKPLVYVAAYYTANPAHGMHEAVEAWRILLELGVTPFVPHVSFLLDAFDPRTPDFWYDYDMEILNRCDAMYVCADEKTADSFGVKQEIDYCAEHGIPVFYSYRDLQHWVDGI
jgi:hypothetical protein